MPVKATFGHTKHVFWTDNKVGNLLYRILNDLVAAEILECRDEPDRQYRWRQEFTGTWE
jgi:hypothetical protein